MCPILFFHFCINYHAFKDRIISCSALVRSFFLFIYNENVPIIWTWDVNMHCFIINASINLLNLSIYLMRWCLWQNFLILCRIKRFCSLQGSYEGRYLQMLMLTDKNIIMCCLFLLFQHRHEYIYIMKVRKLSQ